MLAAIYFVTGRLGLLLPYVGTNITLVWAPTGICMAALLIKGLRLWPGVFLGALLVTLAVKTPLHGGLLIAIGNTLESVAAVGLLNRFGNPDHPFQSPLDLLKFILFFILIGPMSSASLGVWNPSFDRCPAAGSLLVGLVALVPGQRCRSFSSHPILGQLVSVGPRDSQPQTISGAVGHRCHSTDRGHRHLGDPFRTPRTPLSR